MCLRDAFIKYDGDGSQSLDLAEFIALIQNEGFGSEQAAEIYAQVDTSGVTNLEEFAALFRAGCTPNHIFFIPPCADFYPVTLEH